MVLTTDSRITKVVKIATDAQGNVYTLQYHPDEPNIYDIYKISPNGSTVTEIKKDLNIAMNGSGFYFFFINGANEVCIRPDLKVTQAGKVISKGLAAIGYLQAPGGAFYNSSTAYLTQVEDNTSDAIKCKFVKWNLADGSVTDASFTLADLYKTDDPALFTGNNRISKLKFAADDNDNVYTMMDLTYSSGQLTKAWVIRKAKNGTPGSTLVGAFSIKFPSLDLTDYLGAVIFVSDARGNLYIKANQKDIIRITQ